MSHAMYDSPCMTVCSILMFQHFGIIKLLFLTLIILFLIRWFGWSIRRKSVRWIWFCFVQSGADFWSTWIRPIRIRSTLRPIRCWFCSGSSTWTNSNSEQCCQCWNTMGWWSICHYYSPSCSSRTTSKQWSMACKRQQSSGCTMARINCSSSSSWRSMACFWQWSNRWPISSSCWSIQVSFQHFHWLKWIIQSAFFLQSPSINQLQIVTLQCEIVCLIWNYWFFAVQCVF